MSSPSEKFEQAYEHHAAGREAEAVRLYHQVVRSDPRHAHAWHQLACIAVQHGSLETAHEYFVRAIKLDGGQAAYHSNLGICLRRMGKMTEAEASFRQAIRLKTDHVAARVNLSLTLYALGRAADAEASADEALRLVADTPEEHCTCAALRLLRGDFARGLAEHEWRLVLPGKLRPTLGATRWNGSPLAGRRILLYAEQGMGDAMQFVRYVPRVIERGGRPVLWVAKTLMPLLADARLCDLAPLDEPAPPCDVHAALLSLPYLFGTTLETVPNEVPYLRANSELAALWRQRLAGVSGYRVGICWQGNPAHPHDRVRSIPLEEFAPLAGVARVRLISLQKCAGMEQLEAMAGQFDVLDLGAHYDQEAGAFLNAAAVMQNLDLVITTDTAIAHLAGALNVPVWMALGVELDWRWMFNREDSPWYPTMRLFRQTHCGDWDEPFGRMAEALRAQVKRGDRPRAAR